MKPVLVVRPEPAATETKRRAERMGLAAVTAPIFSIRPLDWRAPADVEAVMLTSANAVRAGSEALADLTSLPCYAVGPATAEAARAMGFSDVRTGPGDGEALVRLMAAEGVRSAVHPCGRDHKALADPAIRIERRIAYAAEPLPELPAEARTALAGSALTLLHSPRAVARFAELVDAAGLERSRLALAVISEAAADAAGPGWKDVAVAAAPRDEALLELAAKLCQTDETPTERGGADGL